MNRGVAVLAVVVAGIAAVLQSTVLRFAAIAGVQPDLVLIIVVFVAHKNGSMMGQITGLGAGIILDVMGLSPLGFYALIYAVIGVLYGATKGKMFVDPIFMPALLLLVALLLKAVLGVALGGLFGIEGVIARTFSVSYLIELGYSAVVSPVIFGLLRMIRPLSPEHRRGEGL